MATKVRYDKDLLDTTLARDGATLVGEYAKLNRETKVKFVCKCGKEGYKKFYNLVNNGGSYCKDCTCINSKNKIKESNLEKYGVEYPLQNKIIQSKAKITMIERYGVENAVNSIIIKDKIKATNIKKYGVEHTFQSEKVKYKIRKTNLERLGVEYPTQCKKVLEKSKTTCLKNYGVENPTQNKKIYTKIIKTNLKKYGVKCTSQNKEVIAKAQQTNMIKYGAVCSLQNPIIFEKAQKNSKCFKEYKMPSGEIRKVQGYEPFALDILLKTYTEDQIKTDRKDVGRIAYEIEGKSKYYFPDIAIPHENRIIEVKSTWTYKCKTDNIKQKSEATKAKGFVYEIWVFDSKGNRVNMEDVKCEDTSKLPILE